MSRRNALAALCASLLATHAPASLAADRLGVITITAAPFAPPPSAGPSAVASL